MSNASRPCSPKSREANLDQDPNEARVLCTILFYLDEDPHIRRELLICPISFKVNDAISTDDGIGGAILRCAYASRPDGTYGYIEETIPSSSELDGLIAIFVLSELKGNLSDICGILSSVMPPGHSSDIEAIKQYRMQNWASRAFLDLTAIGSGAKRAPFSFAFPPICDTETEMDNRVKELSLHIHNNRSLRVNKDIYLVPLTPYSHLALGWSEALMNRPKAVVLNDLQAVMQQKWRRTEVDQDLFKNGPGCVYNFRPFQSIQTPNEDASSPNPLTNILGHTNETKADDSTRNKPSRKP